MNTTDKTRLTRKAAEFKTQFILAAQPFVEELELLDDDEDVDTIVVAMEKLIRYSGLFPQLEF